MSFSTARICIRLWHLRWMTAIGHRRWLPASCLQRPVGEAHPGEFAKRSHLGLETRNKHRAEGLVDLRGPGRTTGAPKQPRALESLRRPAECGGQPDAPLAETSS